MSQLEETTQPTEEQVLACLRYRARYAREFGYGTWARDYELQVDFVRANGVRVDHYDSLRKVLERLAKAGKVEKQKIDNGWHFAPLGDGKTAAEIWSEQAPEVARETVVTFRDRYHREHEGRVVEQDPETRQLDIEYVTNIRLMPQDCLTIGGVPVPPQKRPW